MSLRSDFHESYSQGEVTPPSERSTGLVFAVVAVIAAVIFYPNLAAAGVCLAFSAGFAVTSWLKPELLKGLNILWFRFGLLLHKIVNPIIMALMFVLAIVPMGLLMQLFRDPLNKRRADGATTYWTPYQKPEDESKPMRNQF